MDEDTTEVEYEIELGVGGQLAKMLVATTAGFVATKLAEKAFMAAVAYKLKQKLL